MDFTPEKYSVERIVSAFKDGSLTRNEEYQRGAAWGEQQRQALIDSIFRKYPLPPLFLEVKKTTGLGGETTTKYEIIDGQQRILALERFIANSFPLLAPNDRKLRLPLSLRAEEALWAEKRYSDLPQDLQEIFLGTEIPVNLVSDAKNPDEVRDLFIRLQSGTPLTRQQIRDAWPGELGPRVERWAGKFDRSPAYRFFDAVDRRGTRDDEDDARDPRVVHRTTCAQLCKLLLARATNPYAIPSINANDLDGLYHEYTQVDNSNNPFDTIEQIFKDIEFVVVGVGVMSQFFGGRKKLPKMTLFALAMLLQDIRKSGEFKLNGEKALKLAECSRDPEIKQNGRTSSGRSIRDYYERWRETLPEGIAEPKDPKRAFDDSQKVEIWQRQSGKCSLCGEGVKDEDAEYDHYPIPHRLGGKTEVENGRLVHMKCHPRGRPKDS